MRQTIIKLGEGADLIIDEPDVTSPIDRALMLTQAIGQEFDQATIISPSVRTGWLPIKIGTTVYKVYYQLKVRRIIDALTAYSEAILHIENNPHMYDQRLARNAITALRKCYLDEIK